MADPEDKPPTPGDTDDKKTKDENKPIIEFSTEQQAKVQSIIDEAQARVYKSLSADIEALKTANTELQKRLDAPPPKDPKDAKADEKRAADEAKAKAAAAGPEEYLKLEAKLAEITRAAEALKAEKEAADKRATDIQRTTKDVRIREVFGELADQFDFIDRNDVFKLIKDEVDMDDEGAVVMVHPVTRAPRVNTSMKHLTLAEFLTGFAKEKPYTVKAKGAEGGSGSGQTRKLPDASDTKVDFDKMSPAEFEAFTQNVMAQGYQK